MIHKIRERLKEPLPGTKAQLEMSSRHFSPDILQALLDNLPEGHRKAGVVLMLFEQAGYWHTALMQRPHSAHAHSNEVSLPGGRYEETDGDLQVTALRELGEEFGVATADIEVLGALSPLYIPRSNIYVQPFVAHWLQPAKGFLPDPNEVVEILPTPISWLQEAARKKITDLPYTKKDGSQHALRDVPYFDLHDRIVWGATAMMLNEFAALLAD